MNIVNKKDKNGQTPLGEAIQNEGNNMVSMVETLLKAGANPNLKCSEHSDYAYPIDFAVSYYIRMFGVSRYIEMANAKRVIQLLINHGAKETLELKRILKREEGDLNWQPFVDDLKFMFGINESAKGYKKYYSSNSKYKTFGEIAHDITVESENNTPEEIIEWKKKYRIKDDSLAVWVSPYKWVAYAYTQLASERDRIFHKHIYKDDEINEYSSKDGFIIAESNDEDYGFIFIKRRNMNESVDINQPDDRGYTPLYQAIRMGRVETIKFLLDKGANPNFTPEVAKLNGWNWSPLFVLIQEGENRTFNLFADLINYGDRIEKIYESIKLLIKYGANTDKEKKEVEQAVKSYSGNSPRPQSAKKYYNKVLKILSGEDNE